MAIDKTIGDIAGAATTVQRYVNTGIGAAQVVAKIVNPRSITRLAKDSVFAFPMIISSSIDSDEIQILAKSAERNYAALMASVVSLYGYVDLAKYGSLVEYLKKFHQNGNIGGIMESATIDTTSEVVDVAMESLWDNVKDSLDCEPINNLYQPYKKSEATIKFALEQARIATEADAIDVIEDKLTGLKDQSQERESAARQGLKYNDKIGVVEDRTLSNAVPTIVNMQFVVDKNKDSAANVWTQNIVIGIKAMVRMVKSTNMIVNIGEASRDRGIFKFIDWTKGERKTADILFGDFKDGKASVDKNNKWIKALKARKKNAGWQKWISKRELMPNTTIIMTEQEALAVKDQYGVDLTNPANATKMMTKYFMLGFGIYDTESKIVDMIYDGDSSFDSISIRTLVAQNRKETNLLLNN